jgi:predicted phosphodiesterase
MKPRYGSVKGNGLFLVADPHVAANPPGQRLNSYCADILDKIEACLKESAKRGLVPVFLGDLFHWPRENPNKLLVDLIELFRDYRPFILVGNHDKYQARFTSDVSLAVLEVAGVIRLMNEPGEQFILQTDQGNALIGAAPDGFPIPKSYEREEGLVSVLWLTHHNIAFPDYEKPHYSIKDIPGIDWVINGHIHRPKDTVKKGSTTWANPGNITRMVFCRGALEKIPQASIWKPGIDDLEKWTVPHKDFYDVFPDQDFPQEEAQVPLSESGFLRGLERLAWKRTSEGAGLKQFLTENLNPEDPESDLIWKLYKEVTNAE